jgi:hypothetical protein
MPQEKTAPSGTSCPASTRKAARCSVANIPAPPNWNTIFCGAPRAIAGTWQDWHFQPILLRGGADRPRALQGFCAANELVFGIGVADVKRGLATRRLLQMVQREVGIRDSENDAWCYQGLTLEAAIGRALPSQG